MKTTENEYANSISPLYSSPFSRGYWCAAAGEIKDVRVLVMAAMVIAIRVVLKPLSIPLVPNVLYITLGFFANALGSAIYGPLMGLLCGAVSDSLGALLFPTGDYFLPFIITEMLSSFIFGLFLYRARLTAGRIILSRFSVVVICNLILTPVIMRWYYAYFGIESSYKLFTVARMLKNGALLPFEALLLILFIRSLLPVTERLGLTKTGDRKIAITKKNIIFLIIMTAVSAAIIYFYVKYYVSK